MEGEEPVVSLVDVLEEDEELEEEASAVLGASDAEHCSYSQGYVKRQALYACGTCCPPGGAAAGVCLACSYKCHEGHQLYELYTKRNFRCDCGNSKFKDVTCKLNPDKEEMNSENKYSHNFFGLYCTCSRPYPDPEDEVEDQMIQCVVCEDWLHGRHLGAPVPDSVELQELICESCMNHHQFLWTYAAHISGNERPLPDAQVQGQDGEGPKEEEPKGACRLKELQLIGQSRSQSGATFWPSGWRSSLCTCSDCQKLLLKAGSLFLLDEGEGKSLERTNQSADPLMSALDRLNRVQQLELIHGKYNDLKTELKDFLQRFASEGKVVTPDDIRQFFEQQQNRKRHRANGQLYSA
uniref:Putative E3 ubiquitin-protein ligase UBR7 n=1 Tax=Periophthalmus magnuspinnatus TaxID=409849 RepID=A0A3B4BCF3_9GOBI